MENTKKLLEKQIQLELYASHVYRGLSHYFNHPEVAFPGYAKFFMSQATEELKHADEFIDFYQYMGYYYIAPQLDAGSSVIKITDALEYSLKLENDVLRSLEELHDQSDVKTQIFVEDYIKEQITSIKQLRSMLTKTVDLDKTGLLILDRQLI